MRGARASTWLRGRVVPVALLVILLAAVAVGSLMPVSKHSALAATELRRTVNNLLHVPAYAVLTLAWAWALCAVAGVATARAALAGSCAAFFYGVIMELGQLSVPGRTASVGDAMLNAAGAVAAAGALALLARRRAGLRTQPSTGAVS